MTPDSNEPSAIGSLGLSLVPEGRPATMVESNLLTALASSREVPGQRMAASAASISEERVAPKGFGKRLLTPVDLRADGRFTSTGLLSAAMLEDSEGAVSGSMQRLNGVFRRGYVDFEEFRQIVQAEDSPGAEPTEQAFLRAGGQRSKPEITAASKLRHNLRRPIVTARERMAVSSQMVRVFEQLASHTPQLARALATPSMVASGGPASWIASPAVMQEMVRLAPAQRRKIATSFLEAGWSRSDLKLLNLDSGDRTEADRGSESEIQTASARLGSKVPTAIRSRPNAVSERIVRNLARVLTGTEGLVSSIKSGGDSASTASNSGNRLNTAAVASLASFLPLLKTKPNSYFGSLAPEQRVGYTRLSDALTELVSIAENELRQSDGTVSPEVRTSLQTQLGRVGQAAGSALRTRELEPSKGIADLSESRPGMVRRFDETVSDSLNTGPDYRVSVGYRQSADGDMAMVSPPPFESRIIDALSGVQRGPAGVDRLLGLRQDRSTSTQGAGPKQQPLSAQSDLPATLNLENGVGLTSVLAPEIMLHGVTGIRTAEARGYREMPGALASFGTEGRDGSSTKAGVEAGHRRNLSGTEGTRQAAARSRVAAQRGTLSRLLQNVQGTGGQRHRGNGLTPRIIGRLLNRLDERQSVSSMSRLDVGEFALSWLRRVDGQLSGIDSGLEQSSTELASFFGMADTRTSSVAMDSPVSDAKLVTPGVERPSVSGDDSSGLRNLGAAMGQGGRSSQHVSEASSKVDWGFVNTGSETSTAHVDMKALAASAFGSGNAKNGSMPLVAPAVKAVAQTAMRSSKSEEAPAATPSVQQAPSEEGATPASAGGMNDKAMDQLAQEMAGRISRRLKREKDRRGIWA
jgi:hypothetical protein